VAFSRDGKLLAGGLDPGPEGTSDTVCLKLWDVETGREPFAFPAAHQGRAWAVAFVPGDALLATAGNDQRLLLWDRSTGRQVRKLPININVAGLVFAQDGKTFVVAGHNQEGKGLRVWDLSKPIAAGPVDGLNTPDGACRCVALSPDGKLLAFGNGRHIGLWRLDLKRAAGTLRGHTGEVQALAFAPDGGVLVSGADDQKVRLWDVRRLAGP
jgi:WD40 repeat protein